MKGLRTLRVETITKRILKSWHSLVITTAKCAGVDRLLAELLRDMSGLEVNPGYGANCT